MSCNANNHPPDCNCGWGGAFYELTGQWSKPDWSQESSHTKPNAKCPVCSAPVFFYRSPEGGAVFFDNLGPPWPKHPCTDHGPGRNQYTAELLYKKKAGWWPLLRETGSLATIALPNKEGTLVADRQERVILIKGPPKILKKDVPLWMRPLPGQRNMYEVSTFETENERFTEVIFRAFGLKALENPEYAKLFQESIHLFNGHSKITSNEMIRFIRPN